MKEIYNLSPPGLFEANSNSEICSEGSWRAFGVHARWSAQTGLWPWTIKAKIHLLQRLPTCIDKN